MSQFYPDLSRPRECQYCGEDTFFLWYEMVEFGHDIRKEWCCDTCNYIYDPATGREVKPFDKGSHDS